MTDSRRQRFVTGLFPALLVPLELLLFGPHTIYVGNQQEFSAPFLSLVVHLAPIVLLVGGGLALLGALLPARVFPHYAVGLVSLGVVLWIQGNLIVGDYGVLNGQDIDWDVHAWRNRHELALWIGLPGLATIAARRVLPAAVFGSRVLIALQLVLLAVSAVHANPETRPTWHGLPSATFEVSSRQNVFHFVLDGFQSDFFHDFIEEDRAAIDRQFAGFTFFPNHIGAFPTTIVSIPAMLTGAVYRNQEPMRRYIDRQFERASLFGVLRAQGFQVDAVSFLSGMGEGAATNFYRVPTPYIGYEAYATFAAWQLADLSLFRHAPHLLKPAIYNDQSWRLQATFGGSATTTARRHMPVTGEAFLDDFAAGIRVGHDRPLYKYVHVGVPHWPAALDADCRYIGVQKFTREHYASQARCAIKRVGEILAKLRAMGLYDSSLIVVSSDHGLALPPKGFVGDRNVFGGQLSVVSGSALALLVVKPPQATGPLRISGAPTMIGDIPATILDALGMPHGVFPGTPALKADERANRPRSFAAYPLLGANWVADYFPFLDVFSIQGWVLDGSSWKFEEPIFAPDLELEGRSRGLYPPQRNRQGITYHWSSPLALLYAPPEARGVELMVRSIAPTPQTVTVEFRNTVLGRVTLGDHGWHTLRYLMNPRVRSAAPGAEWIALRVDPPWRPSPEGRTLGVMTRDLKWTN